MTAWGAEPPVPAAYLDTAIAIGESLLRDAVPVPGGLSWSGDDLMGTDPSSTQVVRGPVGADLYGGAAGISWFLGHLAARTARAEIEETALAGMRVAVEQASELLEERSLSLYTGATGVARAAAEVAKVLDRPQLGEDARALAARVGTAACEWDAEPDVDLMTGLSGVAIGLLGLHRTDGDPELLDACRRIGERLASAARREWWGASWPRPDGGPPLCGLAHGMSGVGWALSEIGWTTGDDALVALGAEAMRYERGLFSREMCAWPDLRGVNAADGGTPASWTAAWCHGALGIGAVRLRIYAATGDLSALAEASAAIQAARALGVQAARDLRAGSVRDVTLCHGLGGVAELFLLAAQVFGSTEHWRAATRIGDLMLRMHEANDRRWPYGLPGTERIPGLFLGMAGIGVMMLRLDDPASIGSPMLAGWRPPSGGPAGSPPAQNVVNQASRSA